MTISLVKEEERHILNALPIVLEKDHQFQIALYTVLSKTFATKDDLKQILEEMRISREESNKRFEQVNRRIEKIDKRIEQIDKRIEQIDKRIEQGDKRFEEMDRRFNALQEELRISREETNKRFEEMDRRFNALQEELRISREETNKRFEEMDRRFENLQDWVGIVVGGFQRRAGRSLEDAVAGTLRLALKRPDVKPENLKLRTKLIDDEGIIGQKNRKYEIDIYTHDGESLIFEVKSYLELEDVYRFYDKAELAKEKFKLPHPSKVIISLEKGREVTKLCEEMGIILV